MIQDVGEGVTGTPEDVLLESLSSSIPTVTLAASVAAIAMLATIVNKFLDAWERIERIRKIRNELTEIGMKGTAVDELTEQVTTTIEEIVEESTDLVLATYNGQDTGRKNELQNAVSTDIRRLYGQIERGLTVEFHAEPKKDADPESKVALDSIVELSREMKFPPPTNEPLLLGSGEILEGELHKKTSKKTTTKTTIKKETKKEQPEEKKE